MPLSDLDTAAVARTLSQIAERDDDQVEAYFERLEEVELPPDGEVPGLRVRREGGFALRLVRDGKTWLASRDGFEPNQFSAALRQVARVLPAAPYSEPRIGLSPLAGAPQVPELLELPSRLQRAIRARHVAFPLRLWVRRHRRDLQVVGPRLLAEAESEVFFSCAVELPWIRHGMVLTDLEKGAEENLAALLVALFQARHAAPPDPFQGVVVLGPGAAAVLLHEAVAHALEADILGQGGNPESALGLELGTEVLNVLDDPEGAPPGVRRRTDDEGVVVRRRWLLRQGVVAEPLADTYWARVAGSLSPGAARRGNRHLPPSPRSFHLELLAGEASAEDLLHDAEGGLFVPEASRGQLDPLTGAFTLVAPFGRRIRSGVAADPVGPLRLRATVADLLGRVRAVGAEPRSAGAGWCAKGGSKLPVWATAPALRIEGVEVTP